MGPGCGPRSKPKINSEFNSTHFGIEIIKRLKLVFGSKKCEKNKRKILFLILMGPHQGPRLNIYFFCGKSLVIRLD